MCCSTWHVAKCLLYAVSGRLLQELPLAAQATLTAIAPDVMAHARLAMFSDVFSPVSCFDLDAHYLRALQLLEHAIKDACLGPVVHTGVNRVPVAEALGQAVLNRGELLGGDFHAPDRPPPSPRSQLVLTSPKTPIR